MLKVKLGKREIMKKKKLASQYRGISYRADDDVFVVRVPVGKDLKGKTIYFKPERRYTEIDKAVKRLTEVKRLIEKGIAEQRRFTFKDLHNILNEYAEELSGDQMTQIVGQAESTIKQYIKPLNRMKELAPAIYEKSLDEVNKEEIENFLNIWLVTPAKNKKEPPNVDSVNKQFYGIWQSLNAKALPKIQECLNDRNIDISNLKNVLKDTKLPKIKTRVAGEQEEELCYDYEETQKMWREMLTERPQKRKSARPLAKLCFMLQIITGTRISEVIGLKRGDFYIKPIVEGGYCVVIWKQQKPKKDKKTKEGKTKVTKTDSSNRNTPITKEIFTALMDYADSQGISDDDFIFSRRVNSTGKIVSYVQAGLTKYFEEFESDAGVTHIKDRASHGFRHTLITYLGKSGAGLDRSVIQKFCGHKRDDKSTEGAVYESERQTPLDRINFIAGQRALVDCLNNGKYAEELAEVFKKHFEEVRLLAKIERGQVNLTDVEAEYINGILEDENAARKLQIIFDKQDEQRFSAMYDNLPRTVRQEISREDYILQIAENQQKKAQEVMEVAQKHVVERYFALKNGELYEDNRPDFIKKLDCGTKILKISPPEEILKVIANSKQYAKYYYEKVMNDVYRRNNSFDDFLLDIVNGDIKTDFQKSFQDRRDMQIIIEYCKVKVSSLEDFKALKPLF